MAMDNCAKKRRTNAEQEINRIITNKDVQMCLEDFFFLNI